METYQKFIVLIDEYTNMDEWADYACDLAIPLLEAFDRQEWDKLMLEWPQRPTDWQARLAYALPDEPQDMVAKIGEEMLMNAKPSVGIFAFARISRLQDYTPSPQVLTWIKQLLERKDCFSRPEMEEFIQKYG